MAFRHSGFRHPTDTVTTVQAPRDVGTSRRSAEIGSPHTLHTRESATIVITPSDPWHPLRHFHGAPGDGRKQDPP
ncbi:hypothetical protein GCM10009820_34480 [Leifsonia soli]